jgi:uncharacterized membrane protein HdeD (DUF308 family)
VIIEWVTSMLVAVVDVALGVVSGFMPDVDSSGLSSVLGVAMQVNGVFPVAEAVTLGTAVVAVRLLAAPVSAVLSRVTVFGIGPLWHR